MGAGVRAALCVAVSATSELHIKGKDGQIKFTEPGPGIPECVFKKEHCEAARHAAATRIGLEELEKQVNALASQQAVMQSHMTTVAKLLCPKHVPSNAVLDPAAQASRATGAWKIAAARPAALQRCSCHATSHLHSSSCIAP